MSFEERTAARAGTRALIAEVVLDGLIELLVAQRAVNADAAADFLRRTAARLNDTAEDNCSSQWIINRGELRIEARRLFAFSERIAQPLTMLGR